MTAALAAAHIGHEIEHSNAFMGFLIGAAVGLAVGVAIVAAVVTAPVTAGASLLVVAAVGGAVATTGAGALAGMAIGGLSKSPKGPISTGSGNVFYGPARISAARTVLDTVACKDHGTKRLAQGSDSVFINLYPAVRDTDRSECDGEVKSDLEGIYIGAETATYLDIESEVPSWMVSTATWMMWGGTAVALIFGGAGAFVAGGLCGLLSFGIVTGLSFAGSIAGGFLGTMIGEAVGGEKGGIIGGILGSVLGGLLGGRAGMGLSNRVVTGHPVDVATGEMFTLHDDFVIAGILPLAWERFWISGSDENGALGRGWHHPLDGRIVEAGDKAVLRRPQGRLVVLPALEPGQCYYHRAEAILAIRDTAGWLIRDAQNHAYRMRPSPEKRGHFLLEDLSDANGNGIAITRNRLGHIVKVTGSDGVEYLYLNDDSGRIREIRRSAQGTQERLVSYDYDSAGHLILVTDTEGAQFVYRYNAGHLIEQETLRSGYSYHFRWDDPSRGPVARCISTWGDGGVFTRHLSYDLTARVTTETDGMGRTTTHFWDENGLVHHTITPMGHEHLTQWDRYARRLSLTDPEGRRTEFTYDAFARQTGVLAADGARTRFFFASDDPLDPRFFAVAKTLDALGGETFLAFDARANPIAGTDALGNVQTVLRDSRGLTLALRDEEGVLERYSWTAEGRLAQIRNAKGGLISMSYDAFGRLVRQTIEGQGSQQIENDKTGRLIRMTERDGTSKQMCYDRDGNFCAYIDELGNRISWEFGGFGLPVRRIEPDGTQVDYRYDSELNLTEIRNALGEVYRFEYDDDQRLISETEFDDHRRDYDLGAAGDVMQMRDGHRLQRYARDPLGRLTERHSSDGTWSRFGYDLLGRMTEATNQSRACVFAYDAQGGLLREVQDGIAVEHVLSARGQRQASLLPDGRLIRFGWDEAGALTSIKLNDRDALQIGRNRMGQEIDRRAGKVAQHSDYDPQGRLARQQAWREGVVNPVFGRAYSYTATGAVQSIDDRLRGTIGFQYDRCEQLLGLSGPEPERFSFDPAGRLKIPTATSTDVSIVKGRLMMRGDCHYSYDDAGNRVLQRRGQGGRIVTHYRYDDMNQLIEVSDISGRRQRVSRFEYDALGRRIAKIHTEAFVGLEPANDGAVGADVVTRNDVTRFLWDGNVLLAESRSMMVPREGATAEQGEDPVTVDPFAILYIHEPDSFRPAAQIRRHSADQEGEILVYWLDQIGTPLEITNENGELVWQVALRAWGGVGRVLVETIENPIRFQGQYHDTETGLHYNGFRHYDPAAGWYLNPDPIGCFGGLVLSGYVANPIGWTDPLGLAPCPNLKPANDAYAGKPQYTRGRFPHASLSVQEAGIMQRAGFGNGAYNRQYNTWARGVPGLNPISGNGSSWRPDVIAYNPTTNTLRVVEVVSPSQTAAQMAAKANTLAAQIRAANPGVTVIIKIVP